MQSQVQADIRVNPKVNLFLGEFDLFNDDFKQLSSNLLGGEFVLSHDHFKTTNLAPLLQVKHLKNHNFNYLFWPFSFKECLASLIYDENMLRSMIIPGGDDHELMITSEEI